MTLLLMIDDDEKLVALMREYLEPQGFSLAAAHDGAAGLAVLETRQPALVILDLMLPRIDGLEVCRRIRGQSSVPVLMLTARGDDTDRIVGLEMGADDYLPKPFNPRELLARIRAILRRSEVASAVNQNTAQVFATGELKVDLGARLASLADQTIELTTAEFDLLAVLVENAGRVLSREQLLQRIHGPGWAAYDRSVDVHISRLRAKIEADPKHPAWLKTVRGIGYMVQRVEST